MPVPLDVLKLKNNVVNCSQPIKFLSVFGWSPCHVTENKIIVKHYLKSYMVEQKFKFLQKEN